VYPSSPPYFYAFCTISELIIFKQIIYRFQIKNFILRCSPAYYIDTDISGATCLFNGDE